MHDLRHDPNAHAVDERTRYDLPTVTTVTTPTATVPAHVLTPEQLRTVPMPNLRSGTARELDAAVRELDIPRDCTTWTERTDKRLANIEAAIERIADKVTVLRMERDR